MIAVLVALRDFLVAMLVSWLGVAAEPADNKPGESAQPKVTASLGITR